MAEIVSKPDHGNRLIDENGEATEELQRYLDDIEQGLNDNLLGLRVQLTSYTVATLPDPSPDGGLIFVTDEVAGAVPAFSSVGNWLRITDRAIVS